MPTLVVKERTIVTISVIQIDSDAWLCGYDDDEYVRCGYRSNCVERSPWQVTEWEVAAPTKAARKSTGIVVD